MYGLEIGRIYKIEIVDYDVFVEFTSKVISLGVKDMSEDSYMAKFENGVTIVNCEDLRISEVIESNED